MFTNAFVYECHCHFKKMISLVINMGYEDSDIAKKYTTHKQCGVCKHFLQ